MRKAKAIFSSDENALYRDFKDVVSLAWEKMGFTPEYIQVKKDSKFFTPNVPTKHQAQILRVLIPALYPDDIFITSDIDMLPLSVSYFNSCLKLVKRDHLINLSGDAYPSSECRFPICYWVGYGSTFSKVTGAKEEDDIPKIMEEWYSIGHGWDTDEIVFSKKVIDAVNSNLINFSCIRRGWKSGFADSRIDRGNWKIDENLLSKNFYIDSHMLRPLSENKDRLGVLFEYIDKI